MDANSTIVKSVTPLLYTFATAAACVLSVPLSIIACVALIFSAGACYEDGLSSGLSLVYVTQAIVAFLVLRKMNAYMEYMGDGERGLKRHLRQCSIIYVLCTATLIGMAITAMETTTGLMGIGMFSISGQIVAILENMRWSFKRPSVIAPSA